MRVTGFCTVMAKYTFWWWIHLHIDEELRKERCEKGSWHLLNIYNVQWQQDAIPIASSTNFMDEKIEKHSDQITCQTDTLGKWPMKMQTHLFLFSVNGVIHRAVQVKNMGESLTHSQLVTTSYSFQHLKRSHTSYFFPFSATTQGHSFWTALSLLSLSQVSPLHPGT